MNQQAESEIIVNQLRVFPKLRNRAIAALAKNDLSNNQRRIWLTVFKRFAASIYCSPHPAALQIDSPTGSGDFAFMIPRSENCFTKVRQIAHVA
jgi:hypothetical protein